MSQNPTNLLRMLEPAVRPVAQPGSRTDPAKRQPFESRGFDELLGAAQREAGGLEEDAPDPAAPAKPPDPLAALNTIENASLRQMFAQQ